LKMFVLLSKIKKEKMFFQPFLSRLSKFLFLFLTYVVICCSKLQYIVLRPSGRGYIGCIVSGPNGAGIRGPGDGKTRDPLVVLAKVYIHTASGV